MGWAIMPSLTWTDTHHNGSIDQEIWRNGNYEKDQGCDYEQFVVQTIIICSAGCEYAKHPAQAEVQISNDKAAGVQIEVKQELSYAKRIHHFSHQLFRSKTELCQLEIPTELKNRIGDYFTEELSRKSKANDKELSLETPKYTRNIRRRLLCLVA